MKELEQFNEFLSSKDLISLGLWPNETALSIARSRGNCPNYIKIGKKIYYPKNEVIRFINESLQENKKQLEKARTNYQIHKENTKKEDTYTRLKRENGENNKSI